MTMKMGCRHIRAALTANIGALSILDFLDSRQDQTASKTQQVRRILCSKWKNRVRKQRRCEVFSMTLYSIPKLFPTTQDPRPRVSGPTILPWNFPSAKKKPSLHEWLYLPWPFEAPCRSNRKAFFSFLGHYTLLLACTPLLECRLRATHPQQLEKTSSNQLLLLCRLSNILRDLVLLEQYQMGLVALAFLSIPRNSPHCARPWFLVKSLEEISCMRIFIYVLTKSGESTFPHKLILPITALATTAGSHAPFNINWASLKHCLVAWTSEYYRNLSRFSEGVQMWSLKTANA
jgi:hypothetical protein